MVFINNFCYLLMFFILQLHANVSIANSISQASSPTANDGGVRVSITTQVSNKDIQDLVQNRKMVKHAYAKASEMNGLEIESKEMVRKKKKKRLAKTVSLTADYSDPGHHPPRHN